MSLSVIEDFTAKERETFISVCNRLLGRTFVLRLVMQGGKSYHNPEYTFLDSHYEIVRDYLALSGWELKHSDYGYYHVTNELESNRLTLKSTATTVLLALRLIYDDNGERIGLRQDVESSVRELTHRITVDFGILKTTKKDKDDIKDALRLLEAHNIIVRLDGRYGDPDCTFAILPTIITVVSPDKLEKLVERIRRNAEEATYEDSEQDAAD